MFGFINEFLNDVKVPSFTSKSFRLLNIDGRFLCVENFKKIINLDATKITLKLFVGELVIEGENLAVEEIGVESVKIIGNIRKIERVN